MINAIHSNRAQTTLIVSIIIGFIIVFSLLVMFLSQRGSNEEVKPFMPSEFIDTLKEVKDATSTVPSVQPRKEGYSPSDKPFDNIKYAYDQRTADFRLVCTAPCPVSKQILDQEFAAITYSISTIRGLTQSDIDSSLMPFEAHASEDNRCTFGEKYAAYMSEVTDSNGYKRGLLCFFYDKINYDRSKFPYSTSVHEVTHLFEEHKVPYVYSDGGSILWEGISEMLDSFFLKGSTNSFCWQGNFWYKAVALVNNDAHWKGGQLFFDLCNKYGFDYDDLPALFDKLEEMNGHANEADFVSIINSIVGTDTIQTFRNAGVNV